MFITVLALTLTIQCSVALKMPTVSDAQTSGTSLDTLLKGRALYISNCGSCHSLYLPERFTASHWSRTVSDMKYRAKLDNEQASLILQYLTSYCKTEE
ncbi:MAG: hypothetical protein H6540_03480 [Bacteroidales bacterium]|nr:hypothetical protein [Bacteroidales bacterium]